MKRKIFSFAVCVAMALTGMLTMQGCVEEEEYSGPPRYAYERNYYYSPPAVVVTRNYSVTHERDWGDVHHRERNGSSWHHDRDHDRN